MNDEEEIERIGEVFRKNGIGLREIAKWWVYMYPEDVFTGKSYPCIALITQLMKKILEKMKEAMRDDD